MSIENNTGKPARLSLAERAKQRAKEEAEWRAAAEAQAQAQQLVASNNEVAAWLGATPPAESIPPESPLPLNERARLGLLVAETELPVWEILELEFPTKSSQQHGEYADWQETIETALSRGLLVSRPETRITQSETCLTGDWLIDRESYRQWRVTQPNPPAGSDIRLWLGATPGPEPAESIPPVETSLPERRQRIDAISDAIRAALPVLSPSGAYPRPHELFDYLAKNDSTRTITGLANGNRALLWKDNNGNEQRLTFSALGKRLDRIRQGG